MVKAPGLVLDLKGEVDEQVVDGPGGCEGVGGVLILVAGNIAHAQGVDGNGGEVNPSENDDLTIGRQLGKSSDDPGVSILDDAADLALNID